MLNVFECVELASVRHRQVVVPVQVVCTAFSLGQKHFFFSSTEISIDIYTQVCYRFWARITKGTFPRDIFTGAQTLR
jgi:hypothetical protein